MYWRSLHSLENETKVNVNSLYARTRQGSHVIINMITSISNMSTSYINICLKNTKKSLKTKFVWMQGYECWINWLLKIQKKNYICPFYFIISAFQTYYYIFKPKVAYKIVKYSIRSNRHFLDSLHLQDLDIKCSKIGSFYFLKYHQKSFQLI